MKPQYTPTAFIILLCLPLPGIGASYGPLNDNSVESSATVCFNVGAQAALTNLQDFTLVTTNTEGSAGAIYQGSDSFHLESNSPVRVLISQQQLTNGDDSIFVSYDIDGSVNSFDTPGDGIHSGDHVLAATAQLGTISSQRAGDYAGVVTLTIVPQIGAGGGCGESVNTFSSSDGWVTLAYEDLYPNAGDADFNDMVIRYHVAENYNAEQQLETVKLQFEPLARGAGYNHSYHLSLDGELDSSNNINTVTPPAFLGDAQIQVTYFNKTNDTSHIFYNYDKEDDITIFHNTRATLTGFANVYLEQEWLAAKFTTTVDITLENPELNLYSNRADNSELLYRPFLHVKNTQKDIDLVDINMADGMIDSNGSPFGLLVPDTWQWPLERVDIKTAYPYFIDYQNWLNGSTEELSEQALNWYNYPASASLIYTPELED